MPESWLSNFCMLRPLPFLFASGSTFGRRLSKRGSLERCGPPRPPPLEGWPPLPRPPWRFLPWPPDCWLGLWGWLGPRRGPRLGWLLGGFIWILLFGISEYFLVG